MKRFLTLLTLILTLAATVSAKDDLYQKCEKEKSVNTVYISKAMLRMVVEGNLEAVDAGAIALLKDRIDNMLIIHTDNAKGVKFLRELRNDFMTKKNREILMQINDANSDMVMFSVPLSEQKNQYAISVLGKNNATMIVIDGILTLEDIARVTEGMGAKGGMKITKK